MAWSVQHPTFDLSPGLDLTIVSSNPTSDSAGHEASLKRNYFKSKKKIFVAYLKFKFNWCPVFLFIKFGNPTRERTPYLVGWL